MNKTWVGVLSGTLLGGAVGGAVAYFVASRALQPGGNPGEGRATAVRHSSAASPNLSSQMERLRAEIARLASIQNRDEASTERLRKLEEDMQQLLAQRAVREPPEMPTEEQARAEFSQLVEGHERDTKDPDWGPTSTAMLEASLRSESQRGRFSTVSVDCRTTTCVATLEWTSPAAAEEGARWVVAAPLATNCSRQLRISDTAGADMARRAVLLLDCADWRADGSQPLRVGTAANAEQKSGEPSAL